MIYGKEINTYDLTLYTYQYIILNMNEINNVKQTIMMTSLALFSAKGYEGVSVSELTTAACITKPTLYYYFGSKEGVFDKVCRDNYAKLNSVVAENAVYHANPSSYYEDIYKTLTNLAAAYFSFALKNEAFYRIVMANLSMPRSSQVFDVVRKYHFEQYEIVGRMFRDMAKTHGNLSEKDKRLTWSFIGSINSYVGLTYSGVSEGNLDSEAVNQFVRQFMHGIYV